MDMWVAAVTFLCVEGNKAYEGKIFFADTEVECVKQMARYLLDNATTTLWIWLLSCENFTPFEALKDATNDSIEELVSWEKLCQIHYSCTSS
jgi:hypothetical protein